MEDGFLRGASGGTPVGTLVNEGRSGLVEVMNQALRYELRAILDEITTENPGDTQRRGELGEVRGVLLIELGGVQGAITRVERETAGFVQLLKRGPLWGWETT